MTDESPVLAAALRYAAAGVAVFPSRLYVRGNGKKGVNPIRDWDMASSTDPEVIRSWFTGEWRDAALCIDCGKSGIVGVDQDVAEGKDGITAWGELEHAQTWRVNSPTGGKHDYYRADAEHPFTVDNTGAVADGVDIRGMGGFLFAPPSIDPRGGAWLWENEEPDWTALPMVPEVVIKRMEGAAARKRAKVPASPMQPPVTSGATDATTSQLFTNGDADFGPGAGYKKASAASALLESRLEEFLSRTEEGSGRSHFVAQILGVLAGHGVGVFWTYEGAFDTIMEAARENGMCDVHGEAYVADQARRGLEYGMRELWVKQAEDAPAVIGAPITAPAEGGRLRRAILKRSEVHSLPDPVPLIEDVLYQDSVTVLSGKFGSYKSFVAVSWACSLATGVDWFGHRVPRAVPVIYAAAEGAYGIRKRLDAWERAHRTIPDDLYLIPVSVRLNRPEDMRELEEIVVESGAKVLIFDTLHMSTPGVDENDAGQMGAVMDVLREIQRKHGVASILPHHTGHSGERSRGSSSIEDDADTSFIIDLQGEGRGPETPRVLKHRKTKDAALLEPVVLKLELVEGTGSGYVTTANAFEKAAGAEEPEQWVAASISVTEMITRALGDHGASRGLTKSEVHGVVIERFYGGVKGRLNKSTWHTSWNRALEKEAVIQVGGERFTLDPMAVDAAE